MCPLVQIPIDGRCKASPRGVIGQISNVPHPPPRRESDILSPASLSALSASGASMFGPLFSVTRPRWGRLGVAGWVWCGWWLILCGCVLGLGTSARGHFGGVTLEVFAPGPATLGGELIPIGSNTRFDDSMQRLQSARRDQKDLLPRCRDTSFRKNSPQPTRLRIPNHQGADRVWSSRMPNTWDPHSERSRVLQP